MIIWSGSGLEFENSLVHLLLDLPRDADASHDPVQIQVLSTLTLIIPFVKRSESMVNNIERPSTPPRPTLDTSYLQTTPEHVKQREINRLKGLYPICSHLFISKLCSSLRI